MPKMTVQENQITLQSTVQVVTHLFAMNDYCSVYNNVIEEKKLKKIINLAGNHIFKLMI